MIGSGDIKELNTVHSAFDLTQMIHLMYGDPRDNMPPFVKTERHDEDYWNNEDMLYWVPQYLLPSQRFEEKTRDDGTIFSVAAEFADLWEENVGRTAAKRRRQSTRSTAPDLKPIVYLCTTTIVTGHI